MRDILRFGSRKILLYVAAAVLVGLVVSYAVFSGQDSPDLQSEEGILDLTRVHASEDPIRLKGEWAFYWQELLSPQDIQERLARGEQNNRWISIPNSWLDYPLMINS